MVGECFFPAGSFPRRMDEIHVQDAEGVLQARGLALLLGVYLGLVVVAETVVAFGTVAEDVYMGMGLHVALVFALLAHAGLLAARDEKLSRLLAALSLVPLIRVLSLALPFAPFTLLEWLLLMAAPLLAAAGTLMVVQGIRPAQVGLRLGPLRALPLQAAVGASGLALGVLEFFILLPEEPWIPAFRLELLLPAALIVGLSTGLGEELIFRGLVQRQAEGLLGAGPGLLYVALLFAALHLGFRSALDLAFVFSVGLYFGYVVLKTRSLGGVIFAHGLANVALYLVMPFYF